VDKSNHTNNFGDVSVPGFILTFLGSIYTFTLYWPWSDIWTHFPKGYSCIVFRWPEVWPILRFLVPGDGQDVPFVEFFTRYQKFYRVSDVRKNQCPSAENLENNLLFSREMIVFIVVNNFR